MALQDLVRVLRHAHAGELAAGHAYRGNAASVSNPAEKARICQIEEEEWVHRRQVGEMLASLGEGPDPAQERKTSPPAEERDPADFSRRNPGYGASGREPVAV